MADPCDTNPQLESSLNRVASDKFILVMDLPLILKKRSVEDPLLDLQQLRMSIHGSIVPAGNVPAVEVRFAGQSCNVSSFSRPNYPPMRFNFAVDSRYRNYYVLWKWLDLLNTARESVYGGTPLELVSQKDLIESGLNAEYQSKFSIIGLNEYNVHTVEFIYYNAFPTNLGGIDYSYRNSDPIETTAEFQFNQLEMKLL